MDIKTPFLYPILDDAYSSDLNRDASEVIRAGAKILQVRFKNKSNRDAYEIISNLVPVCQSAGVILIVNDRVDICITADAQGVHLGQEDFPVEEARRFMPRAIIGFSTHNLIQIRQADRLSVDYISLGPIFDTQSKLNPDPAVGLDMIYQARALTSKTLVSIGGIHEMDIPEILKAGADGVAMISEIYQKNEIFSNTKRLLKYF